MPLLNGKSGTGCEFQALLLFTYSVDSRVGTDEEPRATIASGITSIQYRQFTSDSDLQVKVANGEDNVQCMSAKFPDHTVECSDVAEIPKPSIVLCPSTFTPKYAITTKR